MPSGEDESTVDDEYETPLEQAVSGAVTALTFLVAFGLMFAEVPYFWIVFVVGFAGVLPMALGAVKLYQSSEDDPAPATDADAGTGSTSGDDTADALETLRERYARGELTEVEFERRVEKLVGTESVEDARTYVRSERTASTAGREGEAERGLESGRELDSDREREPDREPE